jgi:hypothetical protein
MRNWRCHGAKRALQLRCREAERESVGEAADQPPAAEISIGSICSISAAAGDRA